MCGRFVIAKTTDLITEYFEVDEAPEQDFRSYNVAPTTQIPIIVERDIEGAPSREIHPARWGLIPGWAKEVSTTPLINARIESILEKPSFKEAALTKRCAIPADGYYEWQSTVPDSKVPFYIHPESGMLAFELARDAGYRTAELAAKPQDLAGCEVWSLSSLQGIRFVSSWEGVEVAKPSHASSFRKRLGLLSTELGQIQRFIA